MCESSEGMHGKSPTYLFLVFFECTFGYFTCSFFIINIIMCFTLCVYVCVQQAAHSIHLNVHWFVMLIIDVTLSNVHLNVQFRLCMSGESLGTWLLYSHV